MTVPVKIWDKISTNVVNFVKVFLLEHHIHDIMSFFQELLKQSVGRYCRRLPRHVVESETDDLKTIAQLELIEAIKVWDPINNDEVWPLAQTRILGAMRDHIRYLTKSDPTRVYQWVTDQAKEYLSRRVQEDHVKEYDMKDQIQQAMKQLTERERYIVYAHTKLDLTFKVIGEKIELSESQVSRVYKKSLQKLKQEIARNA